MLASITVCTECYATTNNVFQVLEVLCSLCLCNGVAVRANQNLICDNLLPRRDLLLQTRLVNDVTRYHLDIIACMLQSFIIYLFRSLFRSLSATSQDTCLTPSDVINGLWFDMNTRRA